MDSLQKKKSSKFGTIFILVLLLSFVVGGFIAAEIFFENEKPEIQLGEEIEYLGKETDFTVSINDNKTGLRSIKIAVVQGEKEVVLYEKSYPRSGYTGQIGPVSETKEIQFQLDKSGLKDGEAEIVAIAVDYSLRGYLAGNTTELRKKVTIDSLPPKIRLKHTERYISPGGSGIAIYQLSGEANHHGVKIGEHFHKGHLVGDGRDDVYISYFGLPFDMKDMGTPVVFAKDSAGNHSSVSFSPVLKAAKQKFDRINVSDGFLNAKIPEFELHYPEMSGSMKDKYLFTNNEVRVENNQTIFDLCQNSVSERLWKDKFIRMAGASRAGYADHRTYYYNDKEIDKQVHLGMDIASTRRAEVKAANRGKVIYADYLGIYGNMVILDHGQGIFSLYSHMSQIQVAIDDIIDSGVVIGLTGKSGMAGGDHLHFSMLINGIFVTPKEWWDPQWIEVTIEEPLADSRF